MAKIAGIFVCFFLLLATISALNLYNSKEKRETIFLDAASRNIKIEIDDSTAEPTLIYRCLENEYNSLFEPTPTVYYRYDITKNDITITDDAADDRIDSMTREEKDRQDPRWYDWRGDEGEMRLIVSFVGGASGGITICKVGEYLNKYRNASALNRVLIGMLGGASGWYVGKIIATQLMTPKCDSKELLEFLWKQDEEGVTTERWKKLELTIWRGKVAQLNQSKSKLSADQSHSLKVKLRNILKDKHDTSEFCSSDFRVLMELAPELNEPSISQSQLRAQETDPDPADILRDKFKLRRPEQ